MPSKVRKKCFMLRHLSNMRNERSKGIKKVYEEKNVEAYKDFYFYDFDVIKC